MKIGIVSAHKHCKNHLLALREDGYDVHGLGGSPTSIPPSYDALVVRASSCSHGGFNTAVAWGRETGRPLIHENGLSGIRRELTSLVEGEAPVEVQECPQNIYEVLRDSAEAFLFARPDDPPEVAEKALKTVLHQYPEHVSACSSMIPSILAQLYVPSPEPEEMTTTNENEEESMGTKTLPTHRGDFPTHHAWTKVHSVALLTTAYVEATALIDGLSASSLRAFRDAWDSCEKDHSVDMRSALRGQEGGIPFWTEGNESIFLGKPRLFTMFVYLLLGEDHIPAKRTFSKAYKSLTGKTSDTRLPDAVSWYLNRPEPLNMENPTTRKQKQKQKQSTTRRVEPAPITNPLQPVVEQNTESILEVMEDVASMKSRLEAVLKVNARLSDRVRRLETRLEEAISAGFDPRYQAKLAQAEKRIQAIFTTQMQNHKNEISHLLQRFGVEAGEEQNSIESRITALEENRVTALEDRVKALEAPASLQQTGASNPLASLEQVKAALKAAGFKGTLTLTIE
jgi:hypothetical protein